MKRNTKAFTLIELLVVVLIIGILAAVAMPQYQVAVAKSRYATIKSLADSIAQAQDVYYLANGRYANKLEDLDIEVPSNKNEEKSTSGEYWYSWGSIGISGYIVVGRYGDFDKDGSSIQYQIHGRHGASPNIRICIAEGSVSVWDQVCKNETQRTTPSSQTSGSRSFSYR